jgi:aspartyl-tRNA(Asn)/glutamyl-tRNA(Gln) amidotransferase subunit B
VISQRYEVVIGLEVHSQVLTRTKQFCRCVSESVHEESRANINVCPICMGHPGVLPVLNTASVEKLLILASKLGCEIHRRSIFARKNYFYPDLPKGYQITQYDQPIATGGAVRYFTGGEARQWNITRAHLEEDTGKLFHLPDGGAVVDFNRSGVPLLEIVTEPCVFRADEAFAQACADYLDELRLDLIWLGVSDGNMEEGNFRCEPNVSVRRAGESKFGTKVELKNLNSFSTLRKSLEYEVSRHIAAIEAGEKLYQETRRWDEKRSETVTMRRKETADDYRYFDEPDLPPLVVTEWMIDEARAKVVEVPFDVTKRLLDEHGLPYADARQIAESRMLTRYFDAAAAKGAQPKTVANWVLGEVSRLSNLGKLTASPAALVEVLETLAAKKINQNQAKEVFERANVEGKPPGEIIAAMGMTRLDDTAALEAIVDEAVVANPKVIADIKGGKTAAVMALVGAVMKATKGGANPATVQEIVKRKLGVL